MRIVIPLWKIKGRYLNRNVNENLYSYCFNQFNRTTRMEAISSSTSQNAKITMQPGILSVPNFVEDPTLKIQLTPTIPEEVRNMKNGTQLKAVIQPGRHGSEWIRVRDDGDRSEDISENRYVMDVNTLSILINEASSKKKGAVYVGLPQSFVGNTNSTRGRDCLNLLLQNDFEFFNFEVATEELIYKKWVRENTPNMVPPYATSIEGGGCLVLSPDGSEVMLVHEYGRWGRCGGAVDPGESSLETALREVSEETQIELDLERVNPVRIGISYHQPRSRDGRVNDNFVLFIVYAKKRNRDKDITIDHNELSGARWFSIEKLVGEFRKKIDDKNSNEAIKSKEMGKAAASALGPHCEQLSFTDQAFNIPHRFQFEIEEKLEAIGGMELFCLDKFLRGECHPIRLYDNGKRCPAIIW